MILVHFINGGTADCPSAIQVRQEPFTTEGTGGASHPGITCLDSEGKEVGRFRVTEIAGYSFSTGSEQAY